MHQSIMKSMGASALQYYKHFVVSTSTSLKCSNFFQYLAIWKSFLVFNAILWINWFWYIRESLLRCDFESSMLHNWCDLLNIVTILFDYDCYSFMLDEMCNNKKPIFISITIDNKSSINNNVLIMRLCYKIVFQVHIMIVYACYWVSGIYSTATSGWLSVPHDDIQQYNYGDLPLSQ